MIDKRKYGIVYTPDKLARFVSRLIIEEGNLNNKDAITVLDPACGEGALLVAMSEEMKAKGLYYGIDVDKDTIIKNTANLNVNATFILGDFILPQNEKSSWEYWKEEIGTINCIIANPPWSSDKLYEKEKLRKAGYKHIEGQYDAYVLFIESCLKLLEDNGICAFILPDSIFAGENKKLRKMLCKKTSICVVARLGEKLFKDVNRATSVLILKKKKPAEDSLTKCFRLSTDERKMFLKDSIDLYECYHKSVHTVKQSRFAETEECLFDLDILEEDEQLIKKIESDKIKWREIFSFGRGVEISKTGKVVVCQKCNMAQGFTNKQEKERQKKCRNCGETIQINKDSIQKIVFDEENDKKMKKIYVGENLHRYEFRGNRYIRLDVPGINYKNSALYVPPKILIRKTGLGIDACIDNESTYISQTIYSCQYLDKENETPMEYYLALLNSRVIYYYYIKEYGENEWKSHPYFTKDILFSLPIKKYVKTELTEQIVFLAKKMLQKYDRTIDLALESKVMELYELTEQEKAKIKKAINELPNLGAINEMKF